MFSGAIGAVIYTIAEPWLAWAGPLRGVVFGMFLLATASTVVLDPENFDFAILDKDPRNVIMLIALYVAFGAVLVGLQRGLEGRLPAVDEHRPIDSIPVYIAMVMLGSVFLLLILANQFLEPVCECDPPRLTGVFIIGMALSTAAYRLNEATGSAALSSRSIRIAGYLSTAGAFTAGATRAISDIQQLL